MLTPEYLERCPDRMVDLWLQAESDILADMARKINSYDYFSSAVDWQAQKLKEMGLMREEILEKLSKLTGRTVKELKKLMNEAGMTALETDATAYRNAGMEVGAFKDNPALISVMDASLTKTSNSMTNLTRTTAKNGAEQFVEMLDRVYMQTVVGGMSPDASIRQAIRYLARQGLTSVKYGNRTDSMDVAVRRAVRTGINQTVAQLQDTLADEFGTDLVETSAHSGARPSHAEWQGQVFSRSGKSDKYPPFVESTGYGTAGGLCGVNCRHSFYPYFEGDERMYTDKELAELNAKKYHWGGKDMTEYEATQVQRYHERQIRSWKREKTMLQAVGESTHTADMKIAYWNARQDDFLKATGLKRHYDAEKIFDMSKNRNKRAKTSGSTEKAVEKSAKSSIITLSSRYLNKTDDLYVRAGKIEPIDGFEDIVTHGDPYGIVFKDSNGEESLVSADEFVKMLKQDPNYHGGNIRLISCQVGAGSGIVPQHIANELGVDVLAPTENVNVDFDGNMIVADKDSNARKGIETGEWKIFKPKGR